MRKTLGVAGCIALLAILMALPGYAQGPPLPCQPMPQGNGSYGCTTHMSETSFLGAPLGCPGVEGFVFVDVIGNGTFHVTIDKAGDLWATMTFEGQGTISSVTITGPPPSPPGPPPFTVGPAIAQGHFTEWFGISQNNQNNSMTGTTTFIGTNLVTGQPEDFHFTVHENSTPGTYPFPQNAFYHLSC
jgi:hypothetical protein